LRSYDPQIGRFLQNDPYDEFASGYAGMGNDPGNGLDPSGGISVPSNLSQLAAFAVADLNSVTVVGSLAKVGAKAKNAANFLKITTALNDFKQVLSSQLWNFAGGGAAVLDNASGGLINLRSAMAPDAATNPTAAAAYNNGLYGGDIASVVMAGLEGTTGESMMAGGGYLTLTGGGASVGVPVAGAGAVLTAHSFIFFGRAVYNLSNGSGQVKFEGKEPAKQQKFEQASQENTGNQNLQDFKKINGNESANKAAGEAGYKDAHELKKKTLGKKAKVSRYDIYKNNKTGELELRTMDEKQRVAVKKLK
jgi:hypothetical protein